MPTKSSLLYRVSIWFTIISDLFVKQCEHRFLYLVNHYICWRRDLCERHISGKNVIVLHQMDALTGVAEDRSFLGSCFMAVFAYFITQLG